MIKNELTSETEGLIPDSVDMGGLTTIKQERDVYTEQYKQVVKMNIEEVETSKTARALRLKIQKNRTKGIEAWHKQSKDVFLKGGQFVDAIKRAEIAVNKKMEEDLLEIENYFENLEKKRLEELQVKRLSEISKYVEDVEGLKLSEMDDDVYEAYKETKIKNYNARIKQQEIEEAERLAKLEAERKEKEALRIANEKLLAEKKKMQEQKEKLLKIERDKAEAERQEKLKLEAKLKKIETEARLKKEAALKAQRLKEEAERKAAEDLLKKGDIGKIDMYLEALEKLKNPKFESSDYRNAFVKVNKVINQTIDYINKIK